MVIFTIQQPQVSDDQLETHSLPLLPLLLRLCRAGLGGR